MQVLCLKQVLWLCVEPRRGLVLILLSGARDFVEMTITKCVAGRLDL